MEIYIIKEVKLCLLNSRVFFLKGETLNISDGCSQVILLMFLIKGELFLPPTLLITMIVLSGYITHTEMHRSARPPPAPVQLSILLIYSQTEL